MRVVEEFLPLKIPHNEEMVKTDLNAVVIGTVKEVAVKVVDV